MSADPSSLYLHKKGGGLGLPSILTMYQKLRALLCQFLISHDPVICHTPSMQIKRECALTKTLHKPMCVARDVLQCDTGANKLTLVRRVKAANMEKEITKQLERTKSTKYQGQLLCVTEEETASLWFSAVLQLPPQVLYFSMNAAQDTLPHNANLSLWRKSDSPPH